MCAVLAMHVPKFGIHMLWHIPCASLHFSLFSKIQKKNCLLVFGFFFLNFLEFL